MDKRWRGCDERCPSSTYLGYAAIDIIDRPHAPPAKPTSKARRAQLPCESVYLLRTPSPGSPIFTVERIAPPTQSCYSSRATLQRCTLQADDRPGTLVRPIRGTDTCLQAPVYQLHRKPHTDPSSEAATASALISDSFDIAIDKQSGTHLRQNSLRDQLKSSHDPRSTFTFLTSQIRHPLRRIPGCSLTFSSLGQSS
ncbi:hypothetical protein PHSY_007128 [Pseudozyma hubeiensis SY62]|uniref:Uncharacterized protein n=1 Tax=Pseudozyma hubeiensis (strain SY62) TaxID=1305764 RepID=R9PDU3_PSEHS|nr:hypothetical protein PHSY_007128 [Pseudozyma hubeiensis SY62]GAC99526.1 hypothetical protein PHSY_007128 [Pseudozyma hubeiensis SY62]